jgi:ATP-dependent Clp protease ATP-binding subunit ClpB
MVVDPERNCENLEKYGIDLTKMANQGKLDLVIGGDEEIRRCIQINVKEQRIILYSLVSLV